MKPVKPKPSQKTVTGHEIPVPKRSDFMRDLKKVSRPADADALLKKEPKKPPS
ncbi:MAG TPA: hypothetical protein VNV65_01540 [Candidatus Solibacter sp.]|nr:hypothetical protein [Candidatus Solibacter sp.]